MENPAEQIHRTIVIVAYRPKPGKDAELLQLTLEHVPILRAEGLATDMPVTVCQAADGSIIEVFEWEAGAIARAHTNPEVGKLWARYAAVCDFVPLNTLAESGQMFAGFAPVDL